MSLPNPTQRSAIVVTGASSGIGAELARVLASRNYNLLLVARREDRLAALAKKLVDSYGVEADFFPCDLTSADDRGKLHKHLDSYTKEIVGLCNNAGIGSVGTFATLSVNTQLAQLRLNCEAVVSLMGVLLPKMVERGEGAVLNVASTAGFQPIPTMATYSASKAFLIAFSQAVYSELIGTGVSVTCLCPGSTRGTEFGSSAKVTFAPDAHPTRYLSAHAVAVAGVDAMVAGNMMEIPGVFNKLGAIAGRLAPRALMLRIVRSIGGEKFAGVSNLK